MATKRSVSNNLLILLLSLTMVLTLLPVSVFAADDISGHWAEGTMRSWIGLNLLGGDGNGQYRPNDSISRAEFMTLVNNLKGFSEKSDLVEQYTDVAPDKWYYDQVSIALAAGYVSGTSNTTVSPEAKITRQEAMSIIARLANVNTANANLGLLSLAGDGASVATWAQASVAASLENGLVAGSNGNINPLANITRAETVTLLDRVRTDTRTYSFPGTYTGNVRNVVVLSGGVVLKDMAISGDLTISESVGEGHVVLNSVTVGGKLFANGGGANSLVLENCEINEIVITKDGVRVSYADGTTVTYTAVAGENVVIEIGEGATVGTLTVSDSSQGADITLSSGATVENLNVAGDNPTITMQEGSTVETLNLTSGTGTANLNMAEGSTIGTANLDAPANVTGGGTITTANVNTGGTTIETAPTTTNVASNVTATIGGTTQSGTSGGSSGGSSGGGNAPSTPSLTTAQLASNLSNTINAMQADTVTVSGSTVTLKKDLLLKGNLSIPNGVTLVIAEGTSISNGVEVTRSGGSAPATPPPAPTADTLDVTTSTEAYKLTTAYTLTVNGSLNINKGGKLYTMNNGLLDIKSSGSLKNPKGLNLNNGPVTLKVTDETKPGTAEGTENGVKSILDGKCSVTGNWVLNNGDVTYFDAKLNQESAKTSKYTVKAGGLYYFLIYALTESDTNEWSLWIGDEGDNGKVGALVPKDKGYVEYYIEGGNLQNDVFNTVDVGRDFVIWAKQVTQIIDEVVTVKSGATLTNAKKITLQGFLKGEDRTSKIVAEKGSKITGSNNSDKLSLDGGGSATVNYVWDNEGQGGWAILATTPDELQLATTHAKGNGNGIVFIQGTLGKAGDSTIYNFYVDTHKIKGINNPKIYGSFVSSADTILFDGLTIENYVPNGAQDAYKAAIYIYSSNVTVTNCVFNTSAKNNDYVTNGVVIFPKQDDTSVNYKISKNKFNGFNVIHSSGSASAALMIVENFQTGRKFFTPSNPKSGTVGDNWDRNDTDLTIITDNTFNDCNIDYQRMNDWSATEPHIKATSNSTSDNLLLSFGLEGSKHYVTGNVPLKAGSTVRVSSSLIVHKNYTLNLGERVTLTVYGTLDGSVTGSEGAKIVIESNGSWINGSVEDVTAPHDGITYTWNDETDKWVSDTNEDEDEDNIDTFNADNDFNDADATTPPSNSPEPQQ